MVRAQRIVIGCALAISLLFGWNLAAVGHDSAIALAEEPATVPVENDARSRALQRTGLRPYRVDAADILSVQVDFETGTVQDELTVGPKGTITIKDVGELSVAGRTLEDIHAVIQQKIANRPGIRSICIQLLRSDSKVVYVCHKRSDGSEDISQLPCTVDTDLNVLLSTMSWPNPISDEIQITRAIDKTESTYSVRWLNGEALYLLPGDRIFVKSAGKAASLPRHKAVVSQANSRPAIEGQVTLEAKLILDPQHTLVEYNSITKGESLQAEAAATMAMLRILNKNKLIQLTALPSVTCKTGETVKLVTEEAFTITVCPTIKENTTVFMTAKCTFENGDVQLAFLAADGKTLIVPIHGSTGAPHSPRDEAHDSVYLAITPTIMN